MELLMMKHLAKYVTALFYLLGGPLIHAYMMTQQRELYAAVDDTAWPFYQFLWNSAVLPNLPLLVILLVAMEMAAGYLMLSVRPGRAQIGQLAGLLFNLFLIPFWFSYGIPNLLLVAWHYWLWNAEHKRIKPMLNPAV
jgi:hypothetical protein